MDSQGDKHMQTLTTTFLPEPHRPLLHNPHPHWDYAQALKSVYANFPVHCKQLQSHGGYSSALGAAYEWLRDCKSRNGGLQYFLAKGGCEVASGLSHQDALLDQIVKLRTENEGLRTENEGLRTKREGLSTGVEEVKKKHVAEVEGLKRGHARALDEVTKVKDEQVNERAKIEQQRNALQRKLTEARSEVERLRGSRSLDEERGEQKSTADPQESLKRGEGSQKAVQREGPRASLKRRRKEGAEESKREGRAPEETKRRSRAEAAGKGPERNEAGKGLPAETQQGPLKRFRRGKCPGPRGIPRLVGTEYFPRDVRNPETLPVRSAYEPDKPLVLCKPEGTRVMLLEGVFVICHQTHHGSDVTRGRYLTHYDGEYRKKCLDCRAQLSQNRRDKVFVPVVEEGAHLKVLYVKDEEIQGVDEESKGRGRKRGDRTTLPSSYRLPSRLVPFLQKLLPLES